MRTLNLFILASISAICISCSSSTAPQEKPYLVFTPTDAAVFIVDSAGNMSIVTDSTMLVSMNDGSKFHLISGTSDGDYKAFSWQVDDTTDAFIHRLTISALPSAMDTSHGQRSFRANFYPIVSNSNEFVSTLPIIGELVFTK